MKLPREAMPQLLTGIACLVADPNCKEFRRFGDKGNGAYVNVVAYVASADSFTERLKRHLAEMGLHPFRA